MPSAWHYAGSMCSFRLRVPQHRVGFVRLAELLNLFGAELDLGSRRLLDMSNFAGADDGRCQPRLMQQPGVAELGIAFTAPGGEFAKAIHHGEIFIPVIEFALKL